jgi:hypothetical protein
VSRSAATPDGEARAWGWVAHLRDGGTTPWSAWHGLAPPGERAGLHLPGAQQLELLRRLNAEGRPGSRLAARVLATSAPGRGRPDLGLVGVLPETRYGPPPVDPADLPYDELVRVATSLIAEDVVAVGDPAPARPQRRFRRKYRLVGDPELARPLREALIADGRPPGGASATTVVVGTDLDRMLAHVWTARSFGAGVRSWPDYLASEAARRRLSPRIDLAAVAEKWAGRVGSGRVHVVLDGPERAARLAGRRRAVPGPTELSADAVELARRTAPVVGTLVTPERRSLLMWHRHRPVLAAYDGPPVRVPQLHHRWLAEHTADLRRRLAHGDYAVHGHLAEPADRPGVTAPDEGGVLALAVQVLLGPPIGAPTTPREGM